ncbi:MAG TPA: NAD-dependent epimerase/dehydratase family protein [Pyrinomonadaceae bacterium]|nr:NAD-dependent epimerase/dehydratase family protein [Pyrinomonadaceae bacterium]
MRVFIAGATGVLGRGLIKELKKRGHKVLALARNPENAAIIENLGAVPRRGEIFDRDSMARAADGSQVVIHAATSIPTKAKISPRDWGLNDLLRREGTKNLAQAAGIIGAKTFLFQSVAWLAQPSDGSFFDETAVPNPNPVTQSALDGENIANEIGQKYNLNVGILRCGYFYGEESAQTKMLVEGLRRRRVPVVGDGAALWSNLHIEDAARAFAAAAEIHAGGLWNIVDDEPCSVKDFLRYFAENLGVRKPFRVPVWLAKLFVDPYLLKYFTVSMNTSNALAKCKLGWQPKYANYRDGINQIVSLSQQSENVFGLVKQTN